MPKLGISKLEVLTMLPAIRKRLKKTLPHGNLDVIEGLLTVGWLCRKFARAANSEYESMFRTMEQSFQKTAVLIAKEENMARIELGITIGEILGMLPEILSEAWASYSDDKKIGVDEALILIGVILREMAEAADTEDVANFLIAQAESFEALSVFFVEAEVVVE